MKQKKGDETKGPTHPKRTLHLKQSQFNQKMKFYNFLLFLSVLIKCAPVEAGLLPLKFLQAKIKETNADMRWIAQRFHYYQQEKITGKMNNLLTPEQLRYYEKEMDFFERQWADVDKKRNLLIADLQKHFEKPEQS